VSSMNEQAQARLAELKREYQVGEGQLGELARREATLRDLLQRIAGAIQVLEELLVGDAGPAGAGPASVGPASADQVGQEAGENGSRGEPAVLTVP
jgi:hypothetical protein